MVEPITTGGIFILLISSIGSWLKIFRDTRKQNGNGSDLREIKNTVKKTDENVGNMKIDIGVIKTDVSNQKKHCIQMTTNIEKQISENTNRIFNMKGKK
ncbi:MAG TPA: hypothetical protein VMW42_01445 [Desulfatiglandales bacterium]|nr:hypothetical protein [Desulfatiglandales bacterium]